MCSLRYGNKRADSLSGSSSATNSSLVASASSRSTSLANSSHSYNTLNQWKSKREYQSQRTRDNQYEAQLNFYASLYKDDQDIDRDFVDFTDCLDPDLLNEQSGILDLEKGKLQDQYDLEQYEKMEEERIFNDELELKDQLDMMDELELNLVHLKIEKTSDPSPNIEMKPASTTLP